MSYILPGYKDISIIENHLTTKNPLFWEKRGEKKSLELFHKAAKRIPAYQDFLRNNNFDENRVQTINDFKSIPLVTKENYLKKYPLEKLCWDGQFDSEQWVISTTSGSTGNPFYFPRSEHQDDMYQLTAELYLRNNFNIDKMSTLYINGFAMGAWIGGIFTYEVIKALARKKKYKLSIINPGIFKQEIINAVINLSKNFDQIIIGGYPPMIKDTIDEGIKQKVNWGEYKLGFIFSAEGFNENFREYIIKKTYLKRYYIDTLNHYGSVDLGTMAHETPLSILIRKLSLKHKSIFKKLYDGSINLPTLAQYFPEMFYFEEVENRLVCTASSGIPLIRYDLKDQGGVISYSNMQKLLQENNIEIEKYIIDSEITLPWKLPFVFVQERVDFTVKFFGANIYPETIRKAICLKKNLNKFTGKFMMRVSTKKNHNQILEINIELRKGYIPKTELKDKITEDIIHSLLKENSEYKSNYNMSKKSQIPKIVFWIYESAPMFTPRIKQKWSIQS